MKLLSVASVCFALSLGALPACELDTPPPATPQNPSLPLPPEPAATAQDDSAGATAPDDARYVSGEYTIGADADSYDDNDPAALTDFKTTLDPVGTWADDPTYGTVWTPNPTVVGPDFVPYQTAGHWAYDDDYVWVSDYEWGWAPFHYGHWIFVEGRGWAWVPGRIYRGAWVEWGWDDGYGYVGWYPMAPPFFWFGGVAVGYTVYVGPRWVYCPRGEVFSANVGAHVLAGPAVGPVAARVRVAANPGVGPAPARMGYTPTQLPHATGAPGIAKAQQFARPSTATALGARPPTIPQGGASGRPWTSTSPRPGVLGGGMTPGAQPGPLQGPRRKPVPGATAVPHPGATRAPAFHPPPMAPAPVAPSGGFHPGGGSHPSGGGGHHK